jgi:hypothetical protein
MGDQGGHHLLMVLDNDGYTALHVAAIGAQCQWKCVQYLSDNGGHELLMVQDNNGDTALLTQPRIFAY